MKHKKTNYILILLYEILSQNHNDRKYSGGYQELGKAENGKLLFKRYRFQVYKMKRIMGMDGGIDYTTM